MILLGFVGSRSRGCLSATSSMAAHASKAADVADERPALLPLARALLEAFAQLFGAARRVFLFDGVDARPARLRRTAGLPAKRSAQPPGPAASMISALSGDGREGQSATQRFCGDEDVGHEAEMFAGEHCACAGEAGLHFVGDEHDAVLVGRVIADSQKNSGGGTTNPPSPSTGSTMTAATVSGSDVAPEELFEAACAMHLAAGVRLAVRAAVTIGVRDAVDVAGERLESGLVRMRFAGQRHASVACGRERRLQSR